MFTGELIEGDEPLPIISQPLHGFGGQLPIAGGKLRSECLAGRLGLGIGHGTQQRTGLRLEFLRERVKYISQAVIPTALLSELWRAARVKPTIVQNRFHAATGYDRSLRAFCAEHGLRYQSFWTLTANPHLLADDTVRRLSLQYGRTPAQILFRYLTQIGVTPLTGTTSEAHMREDLAIFEIELTASELKAVSALLPLVD